MAGNLQNDIEAAINAARWRPRAQAVVMPAHRPPPHRLTAAQFSALHTLCSGRDVPVWAALRAHLVDGVPLREAGLAAGVASDPATCYAQTYKARTRALRNLALAYAAAGVAPPAARALKAPHQAALKSGRRVIQAHATQASKSPIQPRSPR